MRVCHLAAAGVLLLPLCAAAAGIESITASESVTALKTALNQGTTHAIKSLGVTDGFLKNPKVKIPLPPTLQKAESTMRLLMINPNTTASITDLVLKTAKRFASKGTNLRAVTGAFGPRYIASRVGYAIAGHAAVDAFANDRGRKDAVVLACFGDPGLAALKEIAKVPVVGMADASILQACAMGNRFSIVTGGERWKSMLEEFVASHGLSSRLASGRANRMLLAIESSNRNGSWATTTIRRRSSALSTNASGTPPSRT